MNYVYDGSFQGLLCCVFESFSCGEMPDAVLLPGAVQLSLFGCREVATDPGKYMRVRDGVRSKLGAEALSLVQGCYLSCVPEREMAILRFVRFGFGTGKGAVRMLAHPLVNPLFRARRQLRNEAHLYKEFVRFSEREGILVSSIEPRGMVLPLLADHFTQRLRQERFLVHDLSHDLVLAGDRGHSVIVPADGLVFPEADEREREFEQLWKLYYDTISIPERKNLRLRMNNMPRRYWKYMTEFLAEPGVPRSLHGADLPRGVEADEAGQSLRE